MSDEILSCPFCGGQGFPFESTRLEAFTIECMLCNSLSPGATLEGAIAAWNRRTPVPAPPDLEARVRMLETAVFGKKPITDSDPTTVVYRHPTTGDKVFVTNPPVARRPDPR